MEYYEPSNPRESSPMVVGLPGLTVAHEPTRIKDILEELSKRDILGIFLPFTEVDTLPREKRKVCHFNLEETATKIFEAINKVATERKIDSLRVGLISNSISAIPATNFLLNSKKLGLNVKAYASISPIIKWNIDLNHLIQKYGGIPVENEFDKRKGLTRIIPLDQLAYLMQTDLLARIASQQYTQNGTEILTILGEKDRISDPTLIRQYHYALGGVNTNLVALNSGHGVPNSNHNVIDFMSRVLTV